MRTPIRPRLGTFVSRGGQFVWGGLRGGRVWKMGIVLVDVVDVVLFLPVLFLLFFRFSD